MAKLRRPTNGRERMDIGLDEQLNSLEDFERNGFQKIGKAQNYNVESLQDSAMGKVKTDGRLSEAQYAALQSLRDRSNSGMSLRDKADLAAMNEQLNSENRGRQDALRSEFAARGGMGGASEAILRAKSLQGDQARAARQAQEIAARSEERRYQANMDAGRYAGSMRDQAFNEDAAKAQADDRIAQYNNNMRNQRYREVWGENASRDRQNIEGRNQNQRDLLNARQSTWQNQYSAGAEEENRRMLAEQEKRKRKSSMMGSVLGAAGAVAGGYFGSAAGPAGTMAGAQAGASIGSSLGGGFAHGGKIPGPEIVPGDHPVNDIMTIETSPGEVVLPKTVASDGDKAKQFVDNLNGNEPSTEEIVGNLFSSISSLLKKR